MLYYDIFINTEGRGVKYIVDNFEAMIDKRLDDLLKSLNLDIKTFLKNIIVQIKDDNYYNLIYLPINMPENLFIIFAIRIDMDQVFIITINKLNSLGQIFIVKPFIFNIISDIILDNINLYNKIIIIKILNYLKFLIFEIFNSFKKRKQLLFEGMLDCINKKYWLCFAKDEDIILWTIDNDEIVIVPKYGFGELYSYITSF